MTSALRGALSSLNIMAPLSSSFLPRAASFHYRTYSTTPPSVSAKIQELEFTEKTARSEAKRELKVALGSTAFAVTGPGLSLFLVDSCMTGTIYDAAIVGLSVMLTAGSVMGGGMSTAASLHEASLEFARARWAADEKAKIKG